MKNDLLLSKKFQVSSFYQLYEWNQLSFKEQETLSGLYDEAEVYGLFKPFFASPNLTSKVAYRNVALLFLHLQQSDILPRCYTTAPDNTFNETLARLVLDGILEIEWQQKFVTGSAAVEAVYGKAVFDHGLIPDQLSLLSIKAIEYALMLQLPDVKLMASRLYSYNAQSWDAARKNKFYESHTVKEFLLGRLNSEVENLLNTLWDSIVASEKKGWLAWATSNKSDKSFIDESITYKLYISPEIAYFPELFAKAVPVITASQAYCFKTGSSIHGLLRADKMVVYFKNMEALKETALLLERELEGFAAQGVPFTKQLDKKGLLSCGVDPLKQDILKSVDGGSWRIKVTDQLASAIIQAQTDKLNLDDSIEFIRAKLFAGGIDAVNWLPVNTTF